MDNNHSTDRLRLSTLVLGIIGAIFSLLMVIHGGILHPEGTKPAFVFLVVPLIWWLLIGIFFLVFVLSSKKESKRQEKD